MIKAVAHVCLSVADLDATVAFYEGVLGLSRAFTFTRKGEPMGAYFQIAPGAFIECFSGRDSSQAVANTGISHFCLEVEDIDALIAVLDAKEVDHTEKKLGCDNSWQTWVTDPDGNRIEFHQYTATSAQLIGSDVAVTW